MIGYRKGVGYDILAGISLGLNFESTHDKEHINQNSANTEVRRRHNVDLLGQIGKVIGKRFMPYALIGGSLGDFKLTIHDVNGHTRHTQHKFGVGVGAGTDYTINNRISTDLQYLYMYYGELSKSSMLGRNVYVKNSPKAFHNITIGVKVKV